MKLSERLESIVSLVPFGASVADVGSDHAEVPLALLSRGSVAFVMGIENKKGPYETMRKALDSSPLKDKYAVSFSDGLSKVDPRVDCAILAGLGGSLIAEILRRDLPSHPRIETIVIDPHSEMPFAYRALMDLGYREERSVSLLEEGHYYEVSRWKKSAEGVRYSEMELSFGPLALAEKPSAFRKHYEEETARLEGILASLPETERGKREELSNRLSLIKEALK